MKFGKFNAGISGNIPAYRCSCGKELKANSFNNLCHLIKTHRIEHGGDLSVGWQDVVGDELCNEHQLPQCTEFKSNARKLSVSDVATFFLSMAKWVAGGSKVVDESEANRRASICATCPKNVKIEGCRGCFRLARKVQILIGDKKTKSDSLLKGCEVCACSLQAKVWLPKDAMAGTRSDDQWPEYCWIRNDQ